MRPALVIGCFSTALLTASRFFGLPVARTGTELLLDRLQPYADSNQVPVTLVDALLPNLEDASAVASWSLTRSQETHGELADLISTVGYTMQPDSQARLRPTAERYLSRHLDSRISRYFKPRRLTRLGLPGSEPTRLAFIPRTPTVRRLARGARSFKRGVSG